MRNILAGYKLFDIDLYKLRSKNFHADMIRDRENWLGALQHCLKEDNEFICPLCNFREKQIYVSYRDYRLFECLRCSAVAPNIDLERLAQFNYHNSSLAEEDLTREVVATFEYRKQTIGKERLAYLQETITGFVAEDENILDVGCGAGYFLSCLKDKRIQNKGLEVNPFCIDYCRNSGLNVSPSEIADEDDETYSVITMFDVLEHLSDPIKAFKTAKKKLRADGYLLAYTPNIHSLSIHLMGGNHNMIGVFNHLCFYSVKSLEYLADCSGFKIKNIDYYGLDIMDYLSMKESENGHPYFEHLRDMVSSVQAIVDNSRLSNSMRILFKKSLDS